MSGPPVTWWDELVRRGDEVLVATEKWGSRPHWQFLTVHLGEDEHGAWLGSPAGTLNARPGHSFVSPVDAVTLVPRDGAGAGERGYVATFYAAGFWCGTYVDITTPPRWDLGRHDGPGTAVLRCADLDLDVVRDQDGQVYVDDEDEFAEHQLTLAYPPDVVAAAERSCALVLAAVQEQRPPFDGATAARWSASLRTLARRDPAGGGA